MGCSNSKAGGAGGSDSKYSPSTVQRAGGSSTEDVQRLTGGDHAAQGITDVSQLRFEEGLKWLQLNNNNIVNVYGLTLPEGLEWLDLHYNQIVDVSGLTLPEGLKELKLYDNQITEVSCITKRSCPNLTELDLSRNLISQAEVDRIREELVGCEVIADYATAYDLLPSPDLKLALSSDLPQKDHGVDKEDDLPPSYDQAGVTNEDDGGEEDLLPSYDKAVRLDTVL